MWPSPVRDRVRFPSLRAFVALLAGTVALLPQAGHASGSGRLDRVVVPTFESVRLVLDARKATYTGSVHVDLKATASADSFQLHSEGLTIRRVALRGARGPVPCTHAPSGTTMLTVRTKTPLKPGTYALDIDFTNRFSTQAQGLYRLEVGGESYSFTQFEADDARKSFPCWDEPSFKIPFQVTLTVPRGHRAVSNTPVLREVREGAMKKVIFRRTKPVPSYVLALATGPLEFVPIRGMSVPGNVVTVKGASAMAGTAAAMAPKILGALERYFGRPYPYEKLDLLAVPEFWPGAMENVGAITFRDEALLVDPKGASVAQLSQLSNWMAHEMAHQWFGDLVTMEWWDDLWLNESFAEWMGDKISDEVNPEYHTAIQDLREAQGAMATDSRLSTRAIRQPVDALTNLLQAADDLAYKKGQCVLAMFESWLGPEAFRAGVIAYLKRHEWGNAVGSDLWNSLSTSSGKDAATAMTTFLDQGGLPLVTVSIEPDGRARLSQRRFLSYGTTDPKDPRWQVPIVLRYSDGGPAQKMTVLLSSRDTTVALPGIHGAPQWVNPNGGGTGYYRWTVPATMMDRLAEEAPHVMTPIERVAYLGNLRALLAAGLIHGDQFARIVGTFSSDPSPEVVSAMLDEVRTIREVFVTPELADPYALYLRRTLGPVLDRFGMQRQPGEASGVSLARPRLLRWLGEDGKDARVLAYADSLARQFLSSPGSIDPSLAGAALELSATHGDRALYDEYKHRFETAQIPAHRALYLTALGNFRDRKLMEDALRYTLSPAVRPQEVFTIPSEIGIAIQYDDIPFQWLHDHYDEVMTRIPPMYGVVLPGFAAGCSTQRLEAAQEFFSQPAHSVTGTDKEMAKMADLVHDCAGLREREGPAFSAYLTRSMGAR